MFRSVVLVKWSLVELQTQEGGRMHRPTRPQDPIKLHSQAVFHRCCDAGLEKSIVHSVLFILEHAGSTHQDLARFRRDRSKHGRKKTLNHCLNVFIKDCLAMKRTKTCSSNPWTVTLILRLSYEEGRSRCDSFLLSKWAVFSGDVL